LLRLNLLGGRRFVATAERFKLSLLRGVFGGAPTLSLFECASLFFFRTDALIARFALSHGATHRVLAAAGFVVGNAAS
jgi:hypothetical protein